MRVLEIADAGSFLRLCNAHLMQNEAENNLLLSSALRLARAGRSRSADTPAFFVLEGTNGKPMAAAMNARGKHLLLSVCEPEHAEFLGRELRERGARANAFLGPSRATETLAQALLADANVV